VRFYRRYLSFEVFVLAGLVLVGIGVVMDVILLLVDEVGVSRIGLAAVAQTLIVVGANAVLVGAMASLLEEK
jgi:hypothetical protein